MVEGMTMMIATYKSGFVRELTDWVVRADQGMILEAGKFERISIGRPTSAPTHSWCTSKAPTF